ncbi:PQQ-like beta-propeller repeat protein [Occultella gossypii]|uniref:Pyrrolo-quinoline quinone repeat domain-containing protein n=1 Tax=Occultella gossypii TaxID=2800820 RepID=A0ABS7SJI2_9MICO|nr:PQQ-like beta-propeller repeat protein [Occultella gossypii]MBZ2199448.1 hypothetical protein [Occultella gossypii]
MGRGAAEEFVLDFDEPDPGPDGTEEPRGPAGRRRKHRGRPRPLALWAGVAVLLVVAGILVAPPPPGPSWGVSPGWSSAPVQQWTVPLAVPAGDRTWMSVQEDHVLVVGEGRVDAYDRADGTRRWAATDMGQCVLAATTPVCVWGSGADARVSVVGEDGAVREVALPGVVAATLHRGDLVALTEDAAGGYELTLHAHLDPAALRWTTAVEVPDEQLGGAPPDILARDDLLLVTTGGLYRASSGEQIPGSWASQRRDSPLVSWDSGGAQQILPGTDGLLDLPGRGWPALIDDGSPPAVAIVQSERGDVAAVAGDGQVRWRAPSGYPFARLDGVILIGGPEDISARATDSGDLLWTRPENFHCPCRGDSSGLLLHAFGPEGVRTGSRLIGLRIADGEVLWELPLADSALVADVDDAFAVLSDQQLTLYSRN